jgi:hypothetical protein
MAGVPLNEEDAAKYYKDLYQREKEEREITERKLFWKKYKPGEGEGLDGRPFPKPQEVGPKDSRQVLVQLDEAQRRLALVTNSMLGLCHALYFGESSNVINKAVLANMLLHLAPCKHIDPRMEELFHRIYFTEGYDTKVPAPDEAPASPSPESESRSAGFANILSRVNQDIEAIRIETGVKSPTYEKCEMHPPQGTYAYGLSPKSLGRDGYQMRSPDYVVQAKWKAQVKEEYHKRILANDSPDRKKKTGKAAADMAAVKAERLAEIERAASEAPSSPSPPPKPDEKRKTREIPGNDATAKTDGSDQHSPGRAYARPSEIAKKK